MSYDPKIQLIQDSPHKTYKINIESENHVKDLCQLLRNHKDRKLEIIINGRNFKFNSIAGKKRFIAGFQHAFNIIEPLLEKMFSELEDDLKVALTERNEARAKAADSYKKYADLVNDYKSKCATMDLCMNIWKERIADIEEDREYLSDQLNRLKCKLNK